MRVRSTRGSVSRVLGGSRDARERDRVAIRVPKKTRARELPDERREVVRDARPRLRRERVRGGGVPLRLGASACALGRARARRLPRRLDGRVSATDGLEARARALLARRGSLRVVGARPGRASRRERADIVVPWRGARRHRSLRVCASRRVRRVGVRRLPARRRHADARAMTPRFKRERASAVVAFRRHWHFNPPVTSSATRPRPPRALDHRRPEDVRAVRHPHGSARDVQWRCEERHEHAFVRALQAPPAVHRQRAPLLHLGAFGLAASTPVQPHAVHPREHAEATRRARRRGGGHHVVVRER